MTGERGSIPRGLPPGDVSPLDRKARDAAHKRKTRRLHYKEYKARNAVNNAIRDGKLKRAKVCEVCQKPPMPERGMRKLQAHHDDYDRPLEVRWVHPKCHDRIHFPKAGSDAV